MSRLTDRFASLTSRLVLTAVGLVAVVSVLVAGATTLAMHASLTDQLDHDVRAALRRAVAEPPTGDRGPRDRDDRRVIELRNQAPGTLIAVVGAASSQGRVVGGSTGDSEPLDDAALAELGDLPTDGRVVTRELGKLDSYRLTATRIGDAVVVTGLPTTDLDDAVGHLLVAELLLTLLGVAVAGGIATVVVRRQLRPLREVAGTAHRVAELPLATGEIDLADRVPDHLTDERTEVGQVGAALNSLLEHVEASLEARQRSELQVRQFVADASHELRTPLATISGYTELARRHPDDVATAATALDKVHEESGRMTGLVEDLLLLARLDSGRPLERTQVDLTRLLLEAVSDARVVAPDHGWRLDLPDEAVEVTGDAQRLHQVLTNLLTNARKHTPAGTTVTVAAHPDGFSVHDDGPGFPPALLGTAFERFTRGDDARTRSPDGVARDGGAGLGLSLVHAIVAAHGGRVTLDSAPGDTTITVILPTEPLSGAGRPARGGMR